MTSQRLSIRLGRQSHLVRIRKHEFVLRRFRGLPLLAVLGYSEAELVAIIRYLQVRNVIEEVRVRGRAEEQLPGSDEERV